MDALMLDGNAVAGLSPGGVRGRDDDGDRDVRQACGATDAVGALHVFRGAGIVMRCPHCDNALVTIACGCGIRPESARCRSPSSADRWA